MSVPCSQRYFTTAATPRTDGRTDGREFDFEKVSPKKSNEGHISLFNAEVAGWMDGYAGSGGKMERLTLTATETRAVELA